MWRTSGDHGRRASRWTSDEAGHRRRGVDASVPVVGSNATNAMSAVEGELVQDGVGFSEFSWERGQGTKQG